MRIFVISLFPELPAFFAQIGLLGKAVERGLLRVEAINPRDFASGVHRSVDDTPYGGGPGMVMMAPPLLAALHEADVRQGAPVHRVLLTPQGEPFRQAHAASLARQPAVALVCGRYEGVDERVRASVHQELSLGDFVMLGGEVAAMAVIEATARLLPDVLGNAQSSEDESHRHGLLEHPQFTRPQEVAGVSVPEVLRSGDHAAISAWRRRQAWQRTATRRPDMLAGQPVQRPCYLAVLHHPTCDRSGEVITTSVTNVDVHDLARSARTYGLAGFAVVTPVAAQRELVERIFSHWQAGAAGALRNPDRAEALARASVEPSLQHVIEAITARHGLAPEVWATSARVPAGMRSLGWLPARVALRQPDAPPLLLLLGTGHGLHASVLQQAHALLAPISPGSDYNHLSVRAAAAILLDRLCGDADDRAPW